MQHFNRADVEPPSCLTDERSSRAREMLESIFAVDAAKLEQTRVQMSPYEIEDSELGEAVRKLFHDRCAFCESNAEVRPYRFRPPEEAGPSSSVAPEFARLSHLYYTWLVNDWANIYAICDDCRPLEPSVFPMRTGPRMPLPERAQVEIYTRSSSGVWPFPGTERQVFLDPCGDENFRLNLAALPDGRIVGLSERADATVRHFRLNRADLVSRRGNRFHQYLDELPQLASPGYPVDGPFRFADLEYGGTWYVLLYQLARRIGSGPSSSVRLTPNRIREYYAQRIGAANFRKQLAEALLSLNADPNSLRRPSRRRRVVMRGKARPVSFDICNFKSVDHLRLELPLLGGELSQKVGVALATDEVMKRAHADHRAPALMILGENAVGKSSILEAIAYLLAGEAARSDLDLPSGSLMLDPDLLGGSGELRAAKLTATFEDGSSVNLEISSGKLAGDREDNESRTPVFAYGAFRIFANDSVGQRASSSVISIFRPENVLPNPERWLVSISEKPLFSEVRRALNQILAIDDEYDGITIQEGRCLLITSGIADDGSRVTTRTPLNLVSSGFRSVLSMACHVLRGLAEAQDASSASLANARAVVLIDEIEAHLHPRWKMRVVQGLRKALPGVTFIMTTHDPLCLRGLSTSELVVLRRAFRRGDAGLPSAVEQLEDLPPVSALTVEQLLTSDFFDLFSTDEVGTEVTLARAGDLLASDPRDEQEVLALRDLRRSIGEQVARALPIGSTEIERLVQEAVEQFLRSRATAPAAERRGLRETTRAKILDLLGRY
ncbi:AAA family ATPase [Bosea sp. RAF48]|uniref:AAA family ATPase n=1 Tax=Bosea sp. RAF48 TaxID=3237480 RepID=UPI003F90F3E0